MTPVIVHDAARGACRSDWPNSGAERCIWFISTIILNVAAQRAQLDPDDPLLMIEVKLRKFAPEIVLGVYRHIVAECRTRNVLPVWVYLPIPGVVDGHIQSAGFAKLAARRDSR